MRWSTPIPEYPSAAVLLRWSSSRAQKARGTARSGATETAMAVMGAWTKPLIYDFHAATPATC